MPAAVRSIHLAQVVGIVPSEYAVDVMLPHLAPLDGPTVRARLGGGNQSATSGAFMLPRRFSWGLVALYASDPRSAVWLVSIPDRFWNLIPEALTDDPFLKLEQHLSDVYTILSGEGDLEAVWPDKSAFKVTEKKDGTLSNTTERATLTPRQRNVGADDGTGSNQSLSPRPRPPVDVDFTHSSGFKVGLSADGKLEISTPHGHTLTLADGTEKVRQPYPASRKLADGVAWTGAVTGTPEEDAGRVTSGFTLTTEQGFTVEIKDDPVNASDRYVRVSTPAGHSLEFRDKPDADSGAKVTTKAGLELSLEDATKKATLKTPAGRSVTLDDSASLTTVTDPTRVLVSSPKVDLADGGPQVARVGDLVNVAGLIGAIITGSAKVTSG